MPELEAPTKGRDVLLMFEKDIGPAIAFACDYNDTMHMAKFWVIYCGIAVGSRLCQKQMTELVESILRTKTYDIFLLIIIHRTVLLTFDTRTELVESLLRTKTDDMFLVIIIQTMVLLTVAAQENLTKKGKATMSSLFLKSGTKPENALNPPKSNNFTLETCSHKNPEFKPAWWMFQFSFGTAYITNITIYYRENYAIRMDGFKLYVSNTSNIPPAGYLCYEDPDNDTDLPNITQTIPYPDNDTDLPNITQTIPCNQFGDYVIYYDPKGSIEEYMNKSYPFQPIVELCYVAINGCQTKFWGINCDISCAKHCIEQHCYPGNGSCIWGCHDENCLEDNMAFNSSVLLNQSVEEQASVAVDGNTTSCVKTQGSEIWIQVDMTEISIVKEIYLYLIVNTEKGGNHTIYASNFSGGWENGTVLYSNESLSSVD
ncbi:unnamed protein product [Mytilus coruscus]|uniref:Fucolectin tachylectin-4 pentraxin-1 domain-containing protein n=1 Tax=Mytilus coruscus TaxID=42192 RepID=A0A6J8BMF5_MYTCO|nr:unnamed protein product [Mytilus coruscus]